MAGCNPRKCSIDFDLGRDTGGVCFADPDCGWSCWCLGTCSVIDADRAEGLAAGALLVRLVAVTPNGAQAWVTASSSDIVVIDTATNTIAQRILLPAGTAPFGISFTADGSRAYVTDMADSQVLVCTPTRTL